MSPPIHSHFSVENDILAVAHQLLGIMIDFRNDPVELFREGYEQYGEIFAVSLGSEPGIVLIGQAHHLAVG